MLALVSQRCFRALCLLAIFRAMPVCYHIARAPRAAIVRFAACSLCLFADTFDTATPPLMPPPLFHAAATPMIFMRVMPNTF